MIRRRKFRFYKGQLKDILRLLLLGKIAQGQYVALFEKKFARYIGTKFAVSTCSGRYALEIILDAFKLAPGDEIIMPAYTLKDLVYLIEAKGLVVKFVDIEARSFNIDAGLIESQITPKTKVIIATHLFGLPCNLEKILQIAKQHKLRVIEDCAHALGSSFKGEKTGSFGDAAFFSFETLKPVNTFGGGMVTTNDAKIAAAVEIPARGAVKSRRVLARIAFGYFESFITASFFYPLLLSLFLSKTTSAVIKKFYLSAHRGARASCSGFSNLQALMGLKQLDVLDERNRQRFGRAKKLISLLNSNILAQDSALDVERVYYFLVAKAPAKEGIEKARRELFYRGIDIGIKEEITDNCAGITEAGKSCPVTSEVSNSNLQLPVYDDLTVEEISKISAVLNKYF